MQPTPKLIRNFSIIAHIDHGKTTLSDRIIEFCSQTRALNKKERLLDSMDLERERGITIKAQAVHLEYQAKDGKTYELNFIDTPGHVDFSYEVSRSLYACEGALLVVDAAQGVEAQTIANSYKAIDLGLEVLPVLNKIDLPQAEPERVIVEIEEMIGIDASGAVSVSAKSGLGIEDLLEAIVAKIPPPESIDSQNLQALIVDSWFDSYLGVVSLIRVLQGSIHKKSSIRIHSTSEVYKAEDLGFFIPERVSTEELASGEVGYLVANIKNIHGAPVGDTVIAAQFPETPALPGFAKTKPFVYAGLYPVEPNQFENFRVALEKLSLNDASLVFEPDVSDALGTGFRCGFLGLLHMEIVQERLEREYKLDIITTAPSVAYEVVSTAGGVTLISNPSLLPERSSIAEIREPISEVTIITPEAYVGKLMQLCVEKRGNKKNMSYSSNFVTLVFDMPLSEVISDFFDRLKSLSQGYASYDAQFLEYRTDSLVKLDILINGDKVDAMSLIVHDSMQRSKGLALVAMLREIIPKQMFEIPIQAAVGAKVIARENVKAMRKNVLAKCYGGDITRKKKLLEKQKQGKKRMKRMGNVEIPQEAFLRIMNYEL